MLSESAKPIRHEPALGRFMQADAIVPEPGNPQALNRFAYAYSNPMKYVDMSGAEPELPSPRPAPYAQAIPTGTPVASVSLGDARLLGALYVSQGLRVTGGVSNDCGPACLAMAMNYAQVQSGGVGNTTLCDALGAVPPLTRLQGTGDEAGATAPLGVAMGFNRLSGARELGWTAIARSSGTLNTLTTYLSQGLPVTVLLVYGDDEAHYVTVTGYSWATDAVSYLDPDPSLAALSAVDRVQIEPWSLFATNWSRRVWWNGAFRNAYIVYRPPKFQTKPMPVPVPVPEPKRSR